VNPPVNKLKEKYQHILDFCLLVKSFYPKEVVTINSNEYYQKLIHSLASEEKQMVNLLVHHLTRLFQNHRVNRSKRIIEIAEEDILTALEITSNILNPEAFLKPIERGHYIQLQLAFPNKVFTSKQAQRMLVISKSSCNRSLRLLVEQDLLERLEYKENKAPYYQLKPFKTIDFEEDNDFEEDKDLEEYGDYSY
jgi:hypothetical protein